ncbi:hypothetical protein OQA88_13146, partial [Cercophora sp. LCS_1]
MLLLALYTLLLYAVKAHGAAVFAHFMVGNMADYDTTMWSDDILLAQEAHIDAFALNIAEDEPVNAAQIANAFSATTGRGFKLFFSFDYAGRGPWERSKVLDLLRQYAGHAAYYREGGLPLVSTFEGWQQFQGWHIIKTEINCLFVPDWSSLGAIDAVTVGAGLIDGLFNWAAWPNMDNGMRGMDTYVDASYMRALGNLPYMMPVSPWFYTNMPGYDKNWRWGGVETLWYDRWDQVLVLKPRWVEIISWNDYGESHYIGPVGPVRGAASMKAFTDGKAPFNYAKDMPHDSWCETFHFQIDLYKRGTATIAQERLVTWYRTHGPECNNDDTTVNTATHLQIEHDKDFATPQGVWFAALLGSPADVE